MAKIIKLNETDLKRIVTKVLNERQQLNEELVTIIAGAAILTGIGMKYFYQSSADKSMEKLHKGCQDPDSIIGKPLMSKQQHIQIANEIGDAIDGMDPTGAGEEDIASALSRVKSIPDYCKVAEEYITQHGEDMYEGIDGDIDFGDWDLYVRQPLTNAIKASTKINDDAKKGGGGEEESSDKEGSDEEGTKTSNGDTMVYNSCSGTYKLGCKDEDDNVVWQLQGCLGVKQTGKFGPNTESSLKEKTGNTSIDEREVWTLCKDEDPGDKFL